MQLVTWIAKQTGKISDRFNDYKFYVKQQPQIIDSSSTVCIQTFDSRDMTASIPCSFRWFTVRNGLTTEIPQFKGNTYICQPADVGCLLQVEITSSDPQCTGTAVITYGPVKFDILLKKQIEMALSTGESTFVVDIGQNNSTKECHLRIEQQRMKIHHIASQTAFTFDYNLIQPKVQILPKIPTRVRIIFNPKYYDQLQRFLSRLFNRHVFHQQIARNPFLQLSFNNRKARDSFVFIVKAFNTKKHLKTTTYVSNLQKQLDFTKITQKDQAKTIDYLQQISQLNYDINKLIQINGKNYMEKRLYLQQTKRLQKEFQQAVSTYVKIIEEKFRDREDFEKSFVVLKEKQEEINMRRGEREGNREELEQKITMLQDQNNKLKQTLSTMHNSSPPFLHSATVPLSTSGTNSPFKRKTIFQTQSPSSKNFIQTPSFQPVLKHQSQESHLKQSLNELSVKYQAAIREIEKLKVERVHLSSLNNKKIQEQFNLDNFDARSVKSVNQNNNNTINNNNVHLRSPSNTSSSLLLSNHSLTNPQRLKFTTTNNPNKQFPIKPLSPQSSLQSFPLISALQHQNTNLKQQLHQLQKIIQQLIQKQSKYKKRIAQLTEQLQMYKRNNDVLNRSQHLSMEMEEYNESQNSALKEENAFLKKQIEHSQALCMKYKAEIKKYKNLDKSFTGEQSLALNKANLDKSFTGEKSLVLSEANL